MPSNLLSADVGFPRLNEKQTADEKIAKIADYLYMLLEQLRYNFGNVDKDNFSESGLAELERLFTDPIYARIADDEGNIAALFLTAEGLGTRVSDAEGNISALTQTAQSLTSRISDAEGDISTLTQTATTLGVRISDAEGNISTLTQTATGLAAQLSDAEGNIAALALTAQGLASRISDAEGNISTLTQTAAGLTTRIGDAEGNISALTQTAAGLQTAVSGVANDLAQNYSTTLQTASAIQTAVSSVQTTIENDVAATLQNYSTLTQTATAIQAEVTRATAAESGLAEKISHTLRLSATDGVTITDQSGNVVQIKKGNLYAAELYASASSGHSQMTGTGFEVYNASNEKKIGLGWYSDDKTNYPYLSLGIGSGNTSNGYGVMQKLGRGLWIGDSTIVAAGGNYPGGASSVTDISGSYRNATGLFIDFGVDKVYKYINGVPSELGEAVFG